MDGLNFAGYQFSWFLWRVRSTNSSTHEIVIFFMNYKRKYYGHKFWTFECFIFVQSMKIGIHKNKAIHSILRILFKRFLWNFIRNRIQWWFVYPDAFIPGWYFRINEFSGLLDRQLVCTWKSVPALFVRTCEISGLSEPRLTNHHCSSKTNWYHFDNHTNEEIRRYSWNYKDAYEKTDNKWYDNIGDG